MNSKLDKFFTYFLYVLIAGLLLSIVFVCVVLLIMFPQLWGFMLLTLIGGAVLYYVEEVKDGKE